MYSILYKLHDYDVLMHYTMFHLDVTLLMHCTL